MPKAPKNGRGQRTRGFGYEREVVNELREKGYHAERMWGSDGRSRGLAKEVDVVWDLGTVQCKRTKKIAAYLQPAETDMVFVREDRGKTLVVLELDTLLRLIKECR